jgi:hypothetical protein
VGTTALGLPDLPDAYAPAREISGRDVSANGDRARLLHVRSEHAYTDNPARALRDEPEAVSADYQARLTRAAYLAREQRKREAWRATNSTITEALDDLVAVVGRDPAVDDAVRSVRRTMAALGRRS